MLVRLADRSCQAYAARRSGTANGACRSNRTDLFHVFAAPGAHRLQRLRQPLAELAYLQIYHPAADLRGTPVEALAGTAAYFRPLYDGVIMANGGLTQASARAMLEAGHADLVSFGAPYIGNPDLVERFRHDLPLAQADQETYYQGGARGYTDYAPAQR